MMLFPNAIWTPAFPLSITEVYGVAEEACGWNSQECSISTKQQTYASGEFLAFPSAYSTFPKILNRSKGPRAEIKHKSCGTRLLAMIKGRIYMCIYIYMVQSCWSMGSPPPPAKGEGSLCYLHIQNRYTTPPPPLWYCGTSRVSWQASRQQNM